METIDKKLVALRFKRSNATYEDAALVQRRMAKKLISMLVRCAPQRRFERIFEIGCGTGLLSRMLAGKTEYGELILNDLMTDSARLTSELPRSSFIHGDAEKLQYPEGLDLIAANAVLQWFASPAPFFRRSAKALNPDGLLLFSTFGEDNLREVRELSQRGLPNATAGQLREALEEDFEVLDCFEERHELPFASPMAVLKHMKFTGVGATGSTLRWTRGRIADFEKRYSEQFGRETGGVVLTYHPILIVGRRKG